MFLSKRFLLLSFLILNPLMSNFSLYAKNAIAHVVTPADQLVNEGQRQLTQIRICLNSIAALIKKNQTYSKEEHDKIIAHFIKIDRMIIERLRNEKFINPDIDNAIILLQMNNTLIDHINHGMNTHFKDLATFNMDDLITKATTTRGTLQPEEILKRLVINNKKLDLLTKKALGLTWYNKVARFIDDKMISPSLKHSIILRTSLAAGTLFMGSYFAWKIFHEQFRRVMVGTDNDPKSATFKHPRAQVTGFQQGTRKLYDTFYGPLIVKNGKKVKPEYPGHKPTFDDLGYINRINALSRDWNFGLDTVGTYVSGFVGLGLAYEFKQNIYPKIAKQMEIFRNKSRGGSNIEEAKRVSQEFAENVRFKDIFGQDEIKRYMQLIVDYMEDPETFDRLGLTPPRGILLIGDTRTGKTFTISALFGELNDMFKRTGQSSKFKLIKLDEKMIKNAGMEAILYQARQNAPCILFIDEIDLLDLQRDRENRTLSQFLTAMGEALGSKDSKKPVLVFAATNRPETLDVALRQPGRFGKELRFEYPNYQDRYKFILAKLQEFSLTTDQCDVTKLAQLTENKSYEAMNMFIKNAIIKARLRGEILTQAHLDEALDEDIYHIIPNYTKDIPVEELKILASHFAGQALLISLLDTKINLAKVTIKQVMTELKEEVMGTHLLSVYTDRHKKEQQRFEYGRIFTHHTSDSINMNTPQEKLALCKMHLGGFIAEELLLGACGYSCHTDDDMANALNIAQSIAFEGFDTNNMPKTIQKQKQDQALAIIEQCKQSARELLTQHKVELQALADALLEQKTLDRDQVAAVIKHREKQPAPIEPAPEAAPAA